MAHMCCTVEDVWGFEEEGKRHCFSVMPPCQYVYHLITVPPRHYVQCWRKGMRQWWRTRLPHTWQLQATHGKGVLPVSRRSRYSFLGLPRLATAKAPLQ